MKEILHDQKLQKRLLIIALCFTTAVATAAITALITKDWSSGVDGDEPFSRLKIIQKDITGSVIPGRTLEISPQMVNEGSDPALAFIKVTVPTYGEGNYPAYTYTVNDDWQKVGGSGNIAVYGYSLTLDSDQGTGPLMNGVTMVDMTATDFKSMADYNVQLKFYLADTNEYSEDLETAWSRIE